MTIIKGIGVSPGVAIAPAFVYIDDSGIIPQYHISAEDVQSEMARFHEASLLAKKEIEALRDRAKKEAGEEQAAIFDAHIMMLDDPVLLEQIELSLKEKQFNVEAAVLSFESEMVNKLSSSQDPLKQEKVSDIHDVVRRLLGHLLKKREDFAFRYPNRDNSHCQGPFAFGNGYDVAQHGSRHSNRDRKQD